MDTREHPEAIAGIVDYFDRNGIGHISQKLDVGDYQIIGHPEVVIDRKHNLGEVVGNVTGEHERFRRELLRAQDAGIQLIVLVEHSNRIKTIEDVKRWQNPRLRFSPQAMSGDRLYAVMRTMSAKYGVEWMFCEKRQTGQRIVEILKERVYGTA